MRGQGLKVLWSILGLVAAAYFAWMGLTAPDIDTAKGMCRAAHYAHTSHK